MVRSEVVVRPEDGAVLPRSETPSKGGIARGDSRFASVPHRVEEMDEDVPRRGDAISGQLPRLASRAHLLGTPQSRRSRTALAGGIRQQLRRTEPGGFGRRARRRRGGGAASIPRETPLYYGSVGAVSIE